MASRIITKKGSGAPLASDLVHGELAVDTVNKRLYTENAGGTIIELGTAPSTIDINAGTIDGTVIGGSSAAAGSFTTISASGEIAANGGVAFGDNDKAIFGAGSDLQIYHDGSHSYIKDAGTGNLNIQTDGVGVVIEHTDGTNLAVFNAGDGTASLYHSGNLKLTTTATGIDVTGTVTADGLTVDGDAKIKTGGPNRGLLVGVDLSNSDSGLYYESTGRLHLRGRGGYPLEFNTAATAGTNLKRMDIASNGDISFYEDTGTTAKFFWDASAESLTLPLVYLDDGVITSGLAGSASVFNEDGTTADFRVESSGNTHMLFVDGGLNKVGIGTSSPSGKLDVNISTNARGYFSSTIGEVGSGNFALQVVDATGASLKPLGFRAEDIRFATGSSERMRIDSSGNVGIGTTSTGGYKFDVAGTARADSLSFRSDGSAPSGDAAIFRPAAGSIALATNSTERMRIDSSGRLLLAKTSSDTGHPIEIQANPAGACIALSGRASDGLSYLSFHANGASTQYARIQSGNTSALEFHTGGTERMRIDSSGNVGIGQAPTAFANWKVLELKGGTAGAMLNFENSASTRVSTVAYDDGNDALRIQNFLANPITFETNNTERMRIDSSGNLLVGTTSPGPNVGGFSVDATGSLHCASFQAGGNGYGIVLINSGGTTVGSIVMGASSTTYNITSDQRLKENIVDAPSASDDIDAIQVRSFDWKADGSHQKYGMVAQELQSVAPEAVTGDADSEDMMGVDYSKLVPMMLKEIQSLRARVAQLEGEN